MMDRSAVFIDAGYLLAEGGKLVAGVGSRQRLHCDFAGLIDAIAGICRANADSPIPRSYWYNAASGGIPTAEQLGIARLLLFAVQSKVGRLEALPELRRVIRDAFWESVRVPELPSQPPEA